MQADIVIGTHSSEFGPIVMIGILHFQNGTFSFFSDSDEILMHTLSHTT